MGKNLATEKIDVVILCGGKGERLQSIISDKPKSLTDIGGRSFLDLVIEAKSGKRYIQPVD